MTPPGEHGGSETRAESVLNLASPRAMYVRRCDNWTPLSAWFRLPSAAYGDPPFAMRRRSSFEWHSFPGGRLGLGRDLKKRTFRGYIFVSGISPSSIRKRNSGRSYAGRDDVWVCRAQRSTLLLPPGPRRRPR